ncbi:MAG TPA: glutathione peroxidase [Chitinophagaceae bacterium]|nr:glutathione peroxidase [Chitinophagaceae bacterium]
MRSKLSKALIVIAMCILALTGYILIVNSNSKNMTGRQKVLKAMYPVLAWINKVTNSNREVITHAAVPPPVPLYTLSMVLNDGASFNLASLKGKKLLLVNTASACGYTAQYEQLQQLYNQYNGKLVVIGFPANDFKQQESGTDEEIASFCKKNFGVSFPLAQKSVVIKNNQQNPVFQWLTDPAKNGWNSQAPTWNFSKYLVNEEGFLTHYFGPGIEPMSETIQSAIR